jgi:hypothetical protein
MHLEVINLEDGKKGSSIKCWEKINVQKAGSMNLLSAVDEHYFCKFTDQKENNKEVR